MITLASLLLAAGMGSGLAHRLRLPLIPLLIICGSLAEAVLQLSAGSVSSEFDILRDVLLLGSTFLVFSLGLRLDARLASRHKKAVLSVAAAQFLVLGGLGGLSAWWLGFGLQSSLYLAMVTAASSTIVGVGLLRERRQLFESFGRVTAGVLVVQDLPVILGLSLLDDPSGVATAKMLTLVTAAYMARRWLSPLLLAEWISDEEARLMAVLALLFLFVGAADALGLPFIAGAFLAGLSLSGFPVNAVVRGQLRSLEDFFTAAFFTALGASLLLVSREQLGPALLFVLLVLVVTPLVVTWAGERSGLTLRASLESGLLLAQTSEFSLVAALMGIEAGKLDPSTLGLVVLITLFSMLATPFLATDRITWKLLGWIQSGSSTPESITETEPPKGHVVLIGLGEIGLRILDFLERQGQQMIVLEADPVLTKIPEQRGIPVIRGDGADPENLLLAGARRAKVIVSTLARTQDNQRILRHLEGRTVLVRTDDPTDADTIRSLGGEPIGFTALAADEFCRIPLISPDSPPPGGL